MNWLPLGLMFLSSVAAQSVIFTDQLSLLSDAGNSGLPFSSGLPIGVVDLNGDRKDDIIRLHDAQVLNIEYQTTPDAPFEHYFVGDQTPNPSIFFSLAVADVDENGYSDIVLGNVFLNEGHELLLANATGTAYSSSLLTPVVRISQGVIFTDLDNDGLLDVFACDDIDDLHKWRNTGGGSFAIQDSLLPTELEPGLSTDDDDEGNYALVATDYDNDGDVDYYLSKCSTKNPPASSLRRINRLFRNNGDGTFTDLPGAAGLATGNQTWSADFGDVDNDGDLDCFVLNHEGAGPDSGPSQLFENDGTGVFTDVTATSGLAGNVDFHGLQAIFRDFNNDGWVDLLVSSFTANKYGFYLNDGDGTFTRDDTMLREAGGDIIKRIHSCAVGDLNSDGFLDIYAGLARSGTFGNPSSNPDYLLMNEGNSNGFLSVMLVGDQSNIHGVGARIEAHGPWGTQVREVRGGESYGIMNSYNTHFGIATETEVAQLVVRWPSGVVDTIDGVPGNRFLSIYEGTGAVAMAYSDWSADYFPGGGPEAEPDADPDGDGVKNVFEQLRGTDPKVANGAPGLIPRVEEEEGEHYFRVTLPRVPALDVALAMTFSTDGINWATPAGLEVLEDSQTAYVVRVPVDLVSESSMMARLEAQITEP